MKEHKEHDVLALVDQEVRSAQEAYERAAQAFEQARQRLLVAQSAQQFLANLVVPGEEGPTRPKEIVARA